MIQKKNISAIILAGGKSSRMGSEKGFLEVNGKNFMSRIIAAVKPFVSDIIIVSDNAAYDIFECKRHDDLIKNSGPLAGLFTGLFYSESDTNLVLSCDVPLINEAVIQQLLMSFDAKYEANQLQSEGKTMPLVAIYKKQCMHPFLEQLKKGERRLRTVVEQLRTKTITIDKELAPLIRNINTPSELITIKNEIEH